MINFERNARPASDKTEFPPTTEGRIRRVIFLIMASIAALCGIAVVGSVVVAAVYGIAALIRSH